MNKLSWRHHYIPKFYLNGFVSKNGSFKIYDVKKGQFVKNGKEFFPESYFFEKHSNTMFSPSSNDDFLENYLGDLDNDVAEIFNRINRSSSKNNFNINDNDIARLQYFLGVMYWRNPSNYEEIKHLIKSKTLNQLGLLILNKYNEINMDDEIEKRLKSDINFFKALKFWLPNYLFPTGFKCTTPLHIIPFLKGLPAVCSDNPIISYNPMSFQVYLDDFIFPINSTKVFIRGGKLKTLSMKVKIAIDMIVYKQAKEYVSCTEEKYIEQLDALFEKDFKNINELRQYVFNQVFHNMNNDASSRNSL